MCQLAVLLCSQLRRIIIYTWLCNESGGQLSASQYTTSSVQYLIIKNLPERFPVFNPCVPDVTKWLKPTNGFMFQVSNFYGHLAIITHLNLGVKFLMKIKIWATCVCSAGPRWINVLLNKYSQVLRPEDFLSQVTPRINSLLSTLWWHISIVISNDSRDLSDWTETCIIPILWSQPSCGDESQWLDVGVECFQFLSRCFGLIAIHCPGCHHMCRLGGNENK